MSRRTTRRGFTLLEVMIALALLGFALAMLIKSVSGNIQTTRQSELIGVVTELSRSKMYDIEEILLKDGFTDTDQSEGECGEPRTRDRAGLSADSAGGRAEAEGVAILEARDEERMLERQKSGKPFEDEGWPNIFYAYKIEEVELPSFEDVQSLAQGSGSAAGSGSGAGSGEAGGFQNSLLGTALSQFGGGGFGGSSSENIESQQGASLVQGMYPMFQQILKVSIRKVTLCVTYDVLGDPQELKTVAFFVDPAAMDKVLSGIGSKELEEGAGSGSGSGAGSGSAGGGFKGSGSTGGRGGGRK